MDYYGILGLDKPKLGGEICSERDIRQAYRRKALELHPDKNVDDPLAPVKFNRLTVAFEFLIVEDKRTQYNDQLWEATRKVEKIKRQDVEKQRLARELKEREAAARRKETTAETTSFLNKTYAKKRPTASPDYENETKKKSGSFFADIDQINRERERLAKKENANRVMSLRPEVNADHTFILKLKWAKEREYTEDSLRPLLRPHAPFKVLICEPFSAFIQFFDQSKALAAAMSISMPSDEQALSWSSSFTGVRVIKKPRSGLTSVNNKIASIDIDDDEIQECLDERLRMAQAEEDAAASSTEKSPPSTESTERKSFKTNSVIQRLLKSSRPAVKDDSMTYAKSNGSKMNITEPEVIDLSTSRNGGSSSPIISDDFEKIESDTLSLLRAAIERKKTRK